MRRVLVTRPQPGASRTARRLDALGFAAVLLPLTETHALFVDGAAIPDRVGAVAVTSANAIRHAPPELVAILAGRPCFAVGEKTAETARSAGFLHVTEGQVDAEALARTIAATGLSGPIAYLCGRVRRPVFEELLAAAGFTVNAIKIYDTVGIDYTPEAAIAALGGLPVDATLIYSANAAVALMQLVHAPALRDLFENTAFACLSDRIADALAHKVGGKIRVASEPTEDALLSLLGESG